jgi:hypothetical protein
VIKSPQREKSQDSCDLVCAEHQLFSSATIIPKMVTKSKLKMALDADKNVDYKKKHQQKKAKEARKEQTTKKVQGDWEDVDSDGADEEEDEDEEESDNEAPKKVLSGRTILLSGC